MFRIILVATLAVVGLSHVTSGFNTFRHGDFPLGRTGDLREICQWFCVDTDYSDFFFRSMDNIMNSRIFCGICTKKLTTTGKPTTASSTTSTTTVTPTTPTTTTSTTSTTTTTRTPSSTMAPAPMTTIPPTPPPASTESPTVPPSEAPTTSSVAQ